MRALVTLFSSIGFALAGWVLPLALPALDPLVARGLLALALILLVAAGLLWFVGRTEKQGDGMNAQHSGTGHQFAGNFTDTKIHVGDTHTHTHVVAAKEPRRIDKCFWISAVVLLKPQDVNRRKYIYSQRHTVGRIDLYVSAVNRFTAAIIDSAGEPYSLEAAEGRRGVPLNEVMAVTVEVSLGVNYSRIIIYLDSEKLAEREMPFRIDLGEFDGPLTIAADANGENCAAMHIYNVMANDEILTDENKANLFAWLKQKFDLQG